MTAKFGIVIDVSDFHQDRLFYYMVQVILLHCAKYCAIKR
jgi:hypothetical protein